MTPERAIDIVARELLHRDERLDWEDYPEIGEHDWDRVCQRMDTLAPAQDDDEFREAYDVLTARADGGDDATGGPALSV